MPVMPEDALLDFLGRCLELSQELLPRILESGSEPAPDPLIHRFQELIADIHRHKRFDSVLTDESWEWIWDVRKDINHLQLYGRLAWLNYNLFSLL